MIAEGKAGAREKKETRRRAVARAISYSENASEREYARVCGEGAGNRENMSMSERAWPEDCERVVFNFSPR